MCPVWLKQGLTALGPCQCKIHGNKGADALDRESSPCNSVVCWPLNTEVTPIHSETKFTHKLSIV